MHKYGGQGAAEPQRFPYNASRERYECNELLQQRSTAVRPFMEEYSFANSSALDFPVHVKMLLPGAMSTSFTLQSFG